MSQQILYESYIIIQEGCNYKIRGLNAFTFTTLQLAKDHIDMINGGMSHFDNEQRKLRRLKNPLQ